MIPANVFTPAPLYAAFQPPYNRAYSPLTQTVLGGNAIGDPSAGRQVKNWVVTYSAGAIGISPEFGAVAQSISAAGALTVSLAFDSNMGIVLTWMTLAGAVLYFFDTNTNNYVTRNFDGATSCRVAVDDARTFNSAASDVIFAYTLGGYLYYRQQRDGYNIEYTVGPTSKKLRVVAPNNANRLQFELR